jgi:AcrR family transcriptional regulator
VATNPQPAAASVLTALSSVHGGRGRPRKLDRAAVTRAALRIVERDGLAGLTMRRAAEELGVGLATLYNASGGKEAILDDMIEAVFGQLPDCDTTPGAEIDNLAQLWMATHELLVANPVVAQLIALKRFGGEGLFSLVESTFTLLRGAGMADDLITTAFETVRGYTLGFSLLRISRGNPDAAEARDRLIRASSAAAERYPEINARADDMAEALTAEQFRRGLQHLLQGFLPASPPP